MSDLFLIPLLPQLKLQKSIKRKKQLSLILRMERKFSLTYSTEVAVGLQHRVPVQGLLSSIQAGPLRLREVNSHIPKCH